MWALGVVAAAAVAEQLLSMAGAAVGARAAEAGVVVVQVLQQLVRQRHRLQEASMTLVPEAQAACCSAC